MDNFEHEKSNDTIGQLSIVFWEPTGPGTSPAATAGEARAAQRPQAAEHRTGPWTHFMHARSGSGELGARAQSARDNDSDDRIIGPGKPITWL